MFPIDREGRRQAGPPYYSRGTSMGSGCQGSINGTKRNNHFLQSSRKMDRASAAFSLLRVQALFVGFISMGFSLSLLARVVNLDGTTTIGYAADRSKQEYIAGMMGVSFSSGYSSDLGDSRWAESIVYSPPVSDAKSFQGRCESKRGNPITITTGNKVEEDIDFSTPEEKGLYLKRTWN